jgi:hypothetical protein
MSGNAPFTEKEAIIAVVATIAAISSVGMAIGLFAGWCIWT